ncbi:hypothetical protein CW362_31355 [Streptomyces populi]|uniref:Transposase IS204/IS1001/IS1096/IS1165 zinc-finger domain-containing protein n=1 Tax=Streptomyces populi TaxID=2058924 RepID=A0A2I0SGV6_9ACTN|nr:hypothetical protein [Streptomyces populi]PKT69151.1 hypothetical protein CW362_31355 [Streptomyces populi]
MGSRRVIVRLRVRRYFCDRKSCSRTTFVEQTRGLPAPCRRSSAGPAGWLRSIAIELGGRPAARLCRRLRLDAGRTRLLTAWRCRTGPRGCRGGRQVVREHLAALRAGHAEPVRADIPSPRKITSWTMRPRETLTEGQDERLLPVRLACQDITRACDLARAFADLVRHQRGYLLPEWIRQAGQDAPKPMKGFAGFLRQDLDASPPASSCRGVPGWSKDT